MAEPIRPTGPNPAHAADPSSGAQPRPAESPVDAKPAFRALLERLQEKARSLEEKSKVVDDPAGLAGAVDAARSSLDEAVSLGEQLLEAYREAEHRGPASPETNEADDAGARP